MDVKTFLGYPVVGRGQLAPLETRADRNDFLAAADQVISGHLVPFMSAINSGYFLRSQRVPLIAGQIEYEIPYRAIGRAVRDIKIVSDNNYRYSLTELMIEEIGSQSSGDYPSAFYFSGDTITPYPLISDTYSGTAELEFWYRLRPSQLIEESEAAKILSVSSPSVVVSSIAELGIGDLVDFVSGRSGHRVLSLDQTITNIDGTTITFGSDVVPSQLQAGDWIAPAGKAPVLTMIPEEAVPYLSSLTLINLLESAGDSQGSQNLIKVADEQKKLLTSILAPRNDGPAKKVRGGNPLFSNGGYYQ